MPRRTTSKPRTSPPPKQPEGARKSRPKTTRCGSTSETISDKESFAFSFDIGLAILQQNTHRWSPTTSGWWKRLLNSIHQQEDYLGFIECASSLRELLVAFGDWSAARISARSIRSRWAAGLVTAIDMSLGDLGTAAVVPCQLFDDLATFLAWLKRLPVGIPSEEQSSAGYWETDRRLSNVEFETNIYLPELRRIWRDWFGDFVITPPFSPFHSSGSTADAGRVRARKWRALRFDQTARVCLRGADLRPLIDGPWGDLDRTAKVAFVPKAAGKRRVICMEPAALQFLQHGVSEALVRYAQSPRCPLSRLIDIRSQDHNRELCGRAFDEGLATIDLSDASDSVSWRLVKMLTAGTRLGMYLKGTRSEWTLLEGYRIRMDKYAPMGSALCFPIESYVFASVVELAHRMHRGTSGAAWSNGHAVYGDDIIVPVEEYQLVVDILVSLGFKVNQKKSFSTGPYRESCGVEYTYGWRINTVRHPRSHLLVGGECLPEQVGMVTDLANEFYALGYLRARRLLLKYYLKQTVRVNEWSTVPFRLCVNWSEKGLRTLHASGTTRWINSIQRRANVYVGLRTVASREKEDYQQWLADHPPRTREQRVRELYKEFNLQVDPRFSVKAVICLSYMMPNMLTGQDVEVGGACRTGHLRWTRKPLFSSPVEMP